MNRGRTQKGFTIVELLIVIVVIAILAAITVVAYTGIQDRAKNAVVQSDIKNTQKIIEIYLAQNGTYPNTSGAVYVDANCQLTSVNRRSDWVPDTATITAKLAQNPGLVGSGKSSAGGCYMYLSDGANYVLSAWNAKRGTPSTDNLYRRLGFREINFVSSNFYVCNNQNIGGNASGTYNISNDYYKFSYTVSSLTSSVCNETPPSGA